MESNFAVGCNWRQPCDSEFDLQLMLDIYSTSLVAFVAGSADDDRIDFLEQGDLQVERFYEYSFLYLSL